MPSSDTATVSAVFDFRSRLYSPRFTQGMKWKMALSAFGFLVFPVCFIYWCSCLAVHSSVQLFRRCADCVCSLHKHNSKDLTLLLSKTPQSSSRFSRVDGFLHSQRSSTRSVCSDIHVPKLMSRCSLGRSFSSLLQFASVTDNLLGCLSENVSYARHFRWNHG